MWICALEHDCLSSKPCSASKQLFACEQAFNLSKVSVSSPVTYGQQLAFTEHYAFHVLCIYQFSSVSQSCPTLCNPMNRNTPGLPVHHQLPESTQTHVDWVNDAIQPSHPLPSPSPPAPHLSQNQALFKWVSSSHQVAQVLEFQLQHVLPVNTQDWCALGWTGWISLQSKGLSRVFSNTIYGYI